MWLVRSWQTGLQVAGNPVSDDFQSANLSPGAAPGHTSTGIVEETVDAPASCVAVEDKTVAFIIAVNCV